MNRFSLVAALLLVAFAAVLHPRAAVAQSFVVLGGPTIAVAPQACSPYTLYAPYGGYTPWDPPAAVLYGNPRSCGIGQYPPGFWGTDLAWRYSGPHVHGYTLR